MDIRRNGSEVAIGRLTAAIWALATLLAINIGVTLSAGFRTPSAAAAADPVIGRWLWTKPTNHEHEILPNGTLLCGGRVHGTWRPVDPDKKTYELLWRNRWTDTLTLSPDGNSLVGTNNDGETIEAKRMAFSAPDSAGSDSSGKASAPAAANESPEETVSNAAVIMVVRYEKDGDRCRAFISEILKKAPGTDFDFKVGEEYEAAGFSPRKNVGYGQGAVVFLSHADSAGGPGEIAPTTASRQGASLRKAEIYDSIPAFDNLSLNRFRKLASEDAASTTEPSAEVPGH